MSERGQRFVAAYALTFLTGAAGLIYQVVWQQYLARLVGSDTLATATVLGVFLGGLSFGYLLCGRLTVRVRHLFRTYALLEGLIGVWALAFPWLFRAVTAATRGWEFAPPWGLVLQSALCAVVLLGPPTLCMGGTVPILTRGLLVDAGDATRVHARVYGVNTAGAFVGTLLAGFVLIPQWGLPWTMRAAALLNLTAAAYFMRLPAAVATQPAKPRRRDVAVPAAWVLYAVAFVGGFYFMTLESVAIRFTSLTLGSSSYSFTLIVAVFVVAIALGALGVGRLSSPPAALLAGTQGLVCLGLMVVFVTLDDWPYYAHLLHLRFVDSSSGFLLYHVAVFGALLALLAIPVASIGAMLPLAFNALRPAPERVGLEAGRLFSWNAAGNLLGGLVGGFAIYRWLRNGEVFLLCLLLAAATTCLASVWLGRRQRAAAFLVAAGSLVFALVFPSHDPLRFAVGTFRLSEPLEYSHDGPEEFYRNYLASRDVLAYRDDPEGTFAVIENPRPEEAIAAAFPGLARSALALAERSSEPRPRAIMVNGKSDSSTYYDRETLRLSAHLPALLGAARRQVFVVGLGTGVTAGELALYPDVEMIEVAEIAPGVIDLLPYFDESNREVHRDPRLRIRVGDAFRILERSERRWDIVTSEPSNPWMSGVAQLFSREFYRLVRERLAPGGVLLQWVQRYDTNETIVAIVLETLTTEFPHLRVFRAGGDDLVLASVEPLGGDAEARIEAALAGNERLRESLAGIGIETAADLLTRERERPTPAVSGVIETLDRPRIHYLAGRALFRGEQLRGEGLLTILPSSDPG